MPCWLSWQSWVSLGNEFKGRVYQNYEGPFSVMPTSFRITAILTCGSAKRAPAARNTRRLKRVEKHRFWQVSKLFWIVFNGYHFWEKKLLVYFSSFFWQEWIVYAATSSFCSFRHFFNLKELQKLCLIVPILNILYLVEQCYICKNYFSSFICLKTKSLIQNCSLAISSEIEC